MTAADPLLKKMQDEANAFSMELLMPADWLRADIESIGGIDIEDDTKLIMLAKKYRVSLQVMAIRIGELRT